MTSYQCPVNTVGITSQLEVDDLKQRLADAEGDIKVGNDMHCINYISWFTNSFLTHFTNPYQHRCIIPITVDYCDAAGNCKMYVYMFYQPSISCVEYM